MGTTEVQLVTLAELAETVELVSVLGETKLDWDKRSDWRKLALDYRCTLRYQGRSYSFDYWQQGPITIKPPPTCARVLDCILTDAQCGESDFPEFCDDLGYDTDCRETLRIWKACQHASKGMRRLLGTHYETFLYADR